MIDLYAMLGLGESDGPGADPFEPEQTNGQTSQGQSFGPHAVECDRWAVRRGADLLAGRPELTVGPEAAADFSAAAFEAAPKLLGGCRDADRHRFLAELLDSEAYRASHAHTALNDQLAATAAAEYAEAFMALQAQNPEGVPDNREGDRAVARAAKGAAEAVHEEVEGMVQACNGLGLTPGDGTMTNVDPHAAARVYRKVKNSPRLRKIMEMAGRFRRLAQSKQRVREVHGVGEVVDLTVGGELERMVPAELARFLVPGVDLDTYRRVLQRQATVREHRNPEPVGRGPVVCLIDESRSMNFNNKIETAKGLALAMAWLAHEQGRWCALQSFGGSRATHGVLLPPGRWDEEALLGWLERFMRDSATTLDVLCHTVPFDLWDGFIASGMQRGRTDVILITDGIMNAPANLPEFLAWKAQEKARVLSIVIEADSSHRGVQSVSDEVHPVRNLSADSEAASRAVSIG